MVWMLVAEVMVPLTMDHAYVVAPAGPLAVLPVEFAHTCDGVGVMVGVAGAALMVTLAVLCAEQPEGLVTTRARSTGPEAPAGWVMFWMFVAEVMVPLTMDHAYVVAPAGPLAVLAAELAQTLDGLGVMVGADGLALEGKGGVLGAGV